MAHSKSCSRGKTIRQHITALVKEYRINSHLKDPWHINNGFCQEFADDLVSRLRAGQVMEVDPDWFYTDPVGAPSHAFVKFKGNYYDAETPLGVDDPLKLPIFKHARIKKIVLIRTK